MKMRRAVPAAVLICALSPGEAHAQLGAVLDMIQKLSGPEMAFVGASFRSGYQHGQAMVRALPDAEERLRWERGEGRGSLSTCLQDLEAARIRRQPVVYFDEGDMDRLRKLTARIRRLLDADATGPQVAQAADLCNREMLPLVRNAVEDPLAGFTGWISAARGVDLGDPTDDAGERVDVSGYLASVTGEYRFRFLGVSLGAETGAKALYFEGEIDEDFVHVMIPVQLNVYPFARRVSPFLRNLRIGASLLAVPPLDEDDFAPVTSYEDLGDWEFLFPNFQVGLDYSFGSL